MQLSVRLLRSGGSGELGRSRNGNCDSPGYIRQRPEGQTAVSRSRTSRHRLRREIQLAALKLNAKSPKINSTPAGKRLSIVHSGLSGPEYSATGER